MLTEIPDQRLVNRNTTYKKKKWPKKPLSIESKNPALKIINSYYTDNALSSLELVFSELPPSANQMYEKSVYRNSKSKKSVVNVSLSDDVEIFRMIVRNFVVKNGINYKPENILVAVIELYSPKWLNKDKTPKRKDADNMIKPLFDAIEKASDIPDELFFQHHVFKMHSSSEKCIVKIYEIASKIYDC